MAEGGSRSFKDTVSITSADANECFCDPCKYDGDWKAAKGYCGVCKEFLCVTCLGVHRKQLMTRCHTILDGDQMPPGQTATVIADLCVKVCQKHHPEIVRFYCQDHDVTGCVDCMTLNHAGCSRKRIQDISDNFSESDEIKDVKQKLQDLSSEIETVSKQVSDNMANMEESVNNIKGEIDAVRKQINDHLDKMEMEIKAEAKVMTDEDKLYMKTLITEIKSILQEVSELLYGVQLDKVYNINTVFINTKHAKERLPILRKELDDCVKKSRQRTEFVPQDEMETIFASITPLGKLSRKYVTNRSDVTEMSFGPDNVEQYSASYQGGIWMKEKGDNKNCLIYDTTLLSPSRLVLADGNNCKLKLLDLNCNRMITSLETTHSPTGITRIERDKIAVSFNKSNEIQILHVTSSIKVVHSIKTNKGLRRISYKDDQLAVTFIEPGRVEILSLNGNVLHTICPKQGQKHYFKQPYYIEFGIDNGTVIVSDLAKNLVSVVSITGQVLQSYKNTELQYPRGIVMTEDRGMLVCSWENGRVHLVSPDFKTSKSIIKDDSDLEMPRTIAYSESEHRLYITADDTAISYKNNIMQMYDLIWSP